MEVGIGIIRRYKKLPSFDGMKGWAVAVV